MLQISPDLVCWVIDHARQFHGRGDLAPEDDAVAGGHQSGDDVLADEGLGGAMMAEDILFLELKDTIDNLDPELQANLVALMWLGRGEYDAGDWNSVLEEAKAGWTPRTAEYLLETPLAADYLAEGLAMLGHDCDPER
jgi:hypothetical protein